MRKNNTYVVLFEEETVTVDMHLQYILLMIKIQ